MSIRSAANHDLELLVQWGSPRFAAEAEAELKRRAGQVEASAAGKLPEETAAAARAGGTEAALAAPAFPNGRWS